MWENLHQFQFVYGSWKNSYWRQVLYVTSVKTHLPAPVIWTFKKTFTVERSCIQMSIVQKPSTLLVGLICMQKITLERKLLLCKTWETVHLMSLSIKELTQKKGLMYASIVKKTSLPPLGARIITYTQKRIPLFANICKIIWLFLSFYQAQKIFRWLETLAMSVLWESLYHFQFCNPHAEFTLEGSSIHACIYLLYKWFHQFLLPWWSQEFTWRQDLHLYPCGKSFSSHSSYFYICNKCRET